MPRKEKDAPVRPDLVEFLSSLFACSATTRVALHQMGGADCARVGPLVRQFVYGDGGEGTAPDPGALAQTLGVIAQADCDALGAAQRYGVIAEQAAMPFGRHLLSMRPRGRTVCPSCGGAL